MPDGFQADPFSAARTGMSAELGFMLDTGLLPVGRVGTVPNNATTISTRERVLANIEESSTAREASNFNQLV